MRVTPRVEIAYKAGIKAFSPPLIFPSIYKKNDEFRNFFLTKVINAGFFSCFLKVLNLSRTSCDGISCFCYKIGANQVTNVGRIYAIIKNEFFTLFIYNSRVTKEMADKKPKITHAERNFSEISLQESLPNMKPVT